MQEIKGSRAAVVVMEMQRGDNGMREKREKNVVILFWVFSVFRIEMQGGNCDVKRKRDVRAPTCIPRELVLWPFVLHLDTGGPCDTWSKTTAALRKKAQKPCVFLSA